ncbi:hypothetical protein EDB82DRAFT_241 [Fusarium venenatum]|uniref:uncharacterized protein n=1 Tax=Fusarium venenatum TaxID=56646 RepID=UPI001D8659CC|nr:hypothetical protein EDB82DRAFT_241 [Fusarium venenatum]
MPTFTLLLSAVALSLASQSMADTVVMVNGVTFTGDAQAESGNNRLVGTKCPGVLQVTGDNDDHCCVGGTLNLSTCEGWPLCSGPHTAAPEPTSISCATKIPLTANNYSSLIESASSRYLKASGEAEPSSTGESSMPSATSTKKTDTEGTSTEGTSTEGTTTEGANDQEGLTNSGASPTETGNGSTIEKVPGLIVSLVGGVLALWMSM